MRPQRRNQPVWERWSASRLQTLHTCLRRYAFQYVEGVEVPHPFPRAAGTAVHFLLKRFFQVRYKSRESFGGAAVGFWAGIVNGEHGPEGFRDPPVTIDAPPERLKKYYGTIRKICEQFYDANAYIYDLPKSEWPVVERDFTLSLNGRKVRGKVDRRQRLNGVGQLWDYKGSMTDVQMQQSLQLTVYTAYCLIEAGFPLDALVIYNYYTGAMLTAPPRTEDEMVKLEKLFTEAALIVETAVKHRPLPDALRRKLRHFTAEEIEAAEQGVFLPIMPECPISKECEFHAQCAAWQREYHARLAASPSAAASTTMTAPLAAARERHGNVQLGLEFTNA